MSPPATAPGPFSVWGSVLGGVGSLQGDGNSSTCTYNVGGAAAGIDYRLSPSFLVGLGAGYTNGTQWVDSFQRQGLVQHRSASRPMAAFTQWRLLRRCAGGLRLFQQPAAAADLHPRPAAAHRQRLRPAPTSSWPRSRPATPSASMLPPRPPSRRSPASRRRRVNQAAFTEWGANSLSLNVAQQTTTSVRTVLGAELAGAIGLGNHAHARPRAPRSAGCTSTPIRAADHGGVRRRARGQLHRLRRHAAARRGGDRLPGQHQRRHGHAALPALRRRASDRGTDNHALNLGIRLSW